MVETAQDDAERLLGPPARTARPGVRQHLFLRRRRPRTSFDAAVEAMVDVEGDIAENERGQSSERRRRLPGVRASIGRRRSRRPSARESETGRSGRRRAESSSVRRPRRLAKTMSAGRAPWSRREAMVECWTQRRFCPPRPCWPRERRFLSTNFVASMTTPPCTGGMGKRRSSWPPSSNRRCGRMLAAQSFTSCVLFSPATTTVLAALYLRPVLRRGGRERPASASRDLRIRGRAFRRAATQSAAPRDLAGGRAPSPRGIRRRWRAPRRG